jgi:ATP-dependent DNA helicase RecG
MSGIRRSGASSLRLSSSLDEIRGIGPRRAESLAGVGIATVEDLLLHLPFRYEDRSRFIPIADLSAGFPATVRGTVRNARLRRTRIRGFTLFDLQLEDETGEIVARWFNQPYLRNVLKDGSLVVLHGAPSLPEKAPRRPLFKNPQFEVLGEDPERIHTGRIVPIYRRTADLSTRSLRTFIYRALAALPDAMEDPLPIGVVRRLSLGDRACALRHVHFPPAGSEISLLAQGLTPAHRRLALEELYRLQCAFARSRGLRRTRQGFPCSSPPEVLEELISLAPFRLTRGQKTALAEILADLGKSFPMGRLLQGDVGCGKTVVALLAAIAVMQQGYQVAWMVPTEVLAEQHTRRAEDLLRRTGHAMALLTSQSRTSSGGSLLESIEVGRVDLVIGTHALIQDAVRFHRLALVVVDEQHRFGVRQRELLGGKGSNPHQLIMTATPIPRSLAMALYGDLDVSLIDEMPPGRVPVRTAVRSPRDREKVYRFIREEVGRGGRAAIVVPTIRDSQISPESSALGTFRRLTSTVFPDLRVGLLHGKLSSDERGQIMRGFSRGEVQVLVATTILEVGVDVPEASVMVVEQADRFGLAQLHQIRGRVGRGNRPSWCILIPAERASPEGAQRLRILEEISDGFEIARRDLTLRGSGEFLGVRQSGAPDLRVADLPRDLDLLELARAELNASAGQPFDS